MPSLGGSLQQVTSLHKMGEKRRNVAQHGREGFVEELLLCPVYEAMIVSGLIEMTSNAV